LRGERAADMEIERLRKAEADVGLVVGADTPSLVDRRRLEPGRVP
jgi:hypothetical protein